MYYYSINYYEAALEETLHFSIRSNLTWLCESEHDKQSNTCWDRKYKQDERNWGDSVRSFKSTERWTHTHTYKNIPLSGFLHRHESSIDLRERQVLVTGWLQSQDFTTASFEVRRCSTRCSLTSDGKANQHVSVGLGAAKSAKRRNSIIAALKMPNVVFYSLRSIYIQILEKNKYAMINTIRASNYTVI